MKNFWPLPLIMAFLLSIYKSCQMQFPRQLYFASQRETLHYALALKDEIFEE